MYTVPVKRRIWDTLLPDTMREAQRVPLPLSDHQVCNEAHSPHLY